MRTREQEKEIRRVRRERAHLDRAKRGRRGQQKRRSASQALEGYDYTFTTQYTVTKFGIQIKESSK